MTLKNVAVVAEGYLCNSCGACYAVCPRGAIEYYETIGGYLFPKVNLSKCNSCGICVKVCPGLGLGKTLKEQLPDEPFKGKVEECYIGKAVNPEIFNNSQSGGVVTALLTHLFEKGTIGAAIVAVMKTGMPPRGDVAVVRSTAELIAGQKSKYSPIPILKAVKEIENTSEPFAIVGLSCHIHGLNKMFDLFPKLRKRNIIAIGLMCDRILTNMGIDFLVSGTSHGKANSIVFRDKNRPSYPGNVVVGTMNGKEFVLSSQRRMEIKQFFTPARCRICFDKMNIFSDITVGDPHGIIGVDRTRGESAVLVRNHKGAELISAARTAGRIYLRNIDPREVFLGQRVEDKKLKWSSSILAWKKRFSMYPDFGKIEPDPTTVSCEKEIRELNCSINLDKFVNRSRMISHYKRVLIFKMISQLPKRSYVRLCKVIHRLKTIWL